MGFGQGYSPSEFEGYGIPRKQRASLLEEGIEVIRGMWTQDPFSYEGKHYNLKNISSSRPNPFTGGTSIVSGLSEPA